MIRSVNIVKYLKRNFSSNISNPKLELLNDRIILKIVGNDVSDYLQGLITNDMKHLSEGANSCMYTMFLNTKGRILYDAIVYKTPKIDTFLIDCDVKAADSLQKHLKIYKLRRKIDIINLKDEYSLHALFNIDSLKIREEFDVFNQNIDNLIFSNKLDATKLKNIYVHRDPRIALLGYRIIAPKEGNIENELPNVALISNKATSETYKWFRYNLGVGEGITDLPPENSFPLEANCDYLHGVSFHKGCYIGQELTARTYHTGVIRKRLMPLIFSKIPTSTPDTTIVSKNVNLGKLRGIEGNTGLGLLRIAKSLAQNDINISDGIAHTEKPVWWPIEAPKEKISLQRNE